MSMAVFIIPMIAVMYFLMIRPERKRQTDHGTMLGALKRGDEIVMTSGIMGKIYAIEDKTLVVEIADKTRVKVLKVAVSGPAARYLQAPATDDKTDKLPAPPKTDDK